MVFFRGRYFRGMAVALSSCQGLKLLSSHALWLTEGNIIIHTNSNASPIATVLFWLLFSLHGPRALELSRS